MKSIVTLTVNPAIDVATSVAKVFPNHKPRCGVARRDPGGGGLNVSRAIGQLGGDSLACYLAGGAWAVNPSRRSVGIAHVAFEVLDRATFGRMRRKLGEGHVPFISRNNGISWAMRLKDPDWNEVEIYLDRRHSPGGARLWKGRWHGPLVVEDEAAPTGPKAAGRLCFASITAPTSR